MVLGLMVGAAAFFAVGFFAAGTGKDLKDGSAAEQEMEENTKQNEDDFAKQNEEDVAKQEEEYDYSWAMQGVNRSRIR